MITNSLFISRDGQVVYPSWGGGVKEAVEGRGGWGEGALRGDRRIVLRGVGVGGAWKRKGRGGRGGDRGFAQGSKESML